MDAHRGQLFVEGGRHGLEAGISIDAKTITVSTDDTVWTWPIRDVGARRWDGSQFKLIMGEEEFLFTANDPISFTFDVVDVLRATNSTRTRSKRRPKGRAAHRQTKAPEAKEVVPSPTAAVAVSLPDVWTELASGRDEASLLETLAHLSDHHHQWEDAGDRRDATMQVCSECKQVFVDLIAAEESPDDSGRHE